MINWKLLRVELLLQNHFMKINSQSLSLSLVWTGTSNSLFFMFILSFLTNSIREEILQANNSYKNTNEVKVLANIILQLHQKYKEDVKDMHLGIITPYAAQVAEIKQIFIEKGIPRNFTHPLEFSTVDGFQGREKDIIFISCVRTGIAQQFFFLYFMLLTLYFKAGLGFLTDDRRLNVV